MPVKQDFDQGALMALSAANCLSRVGAVDATISGNATVTLVAAAVRALAVKAGTSQDTLEKVADGLEKGVLAGVLSETHGLSTIATVISTIAGQLPGVDSSFAGFLPQ